MTNPTKKGRVSVVDKLIAAIKRKGLRISFSVNCVSGLVPEYASRCECWRCRKDRGELPDEKLAKKVSDKARKRLTKPKRKGSPEPRKGSV